MWFVEILKIRWNVSCTRELREFPLRNFTPSRRRATAKRNYWPQGTCWNFPRTVHAIVTRLKYNCANFRYFLISTQAAAPFLIPEKVGSREKIHRGKPHKSHRLSVTRRSFAVDTCHVVRVFYKYIYVAYGYEMRTTEEEKPRIFTVVPDDIDSQLVLTPVS